MGHSRLLVIGDGGSTTGYARVVHSVLTNLPQAAYEIHQLAVNYRGDPHGERWPLYPAGLNGDAWGVRRIKELVDRVNPHIVFCVADLWVQKAYLEEIRVCTQRPKIVLYSPVDAGPVDSEWVCSFRGVDRIVMFTAYARSEILKALDTADDHLVDVIPLGVNTDLFFPMCRVEPWNTAEAKETLGLFPQGELEDSFVVLNAHRNQPRKRIDITLKSFALFARCKPRNVQLFLHMGVDDMGWNVLKLAKRYGIDDRLVVPENRDSMPRIASEHLNAVYNACDVGLNTATAEGWGLPNFEHAATGKAQLVPRLAALEEIWSEAADFVEATTEVVYEGVLLEGKVVTPDAVAAGLERLYGDTEYRRNVARNCYRRATQPEYQWKQIGDRWHALFQEVLNDHNEILTSHRQSVDCEVESCNRKARLLLRALAEAPKGLVVEIGCIRQPIEISWDGFSTYYLARRSLALGIPFKSFDIDPGAVRVANEVLHTAGLPELVELGNGKQALQRLGPVAFLHLDSSDDPYDTLDQYLAAELMAGAIVVVDDAHTYEGNKYGKASALVQTIETGLAPKLPYRIHSTEPGFKALVIRVPVGKASGHC